MAEVDVGSGDGTVLADAAGAAITPRDKAMAVAAKILTVLVDILFPSVWTDYLLQYFITVPSVHRTVDECQTEIKKYRWPVLSPTVRLKMVT
ncbi:hypothetical protein [Nocardia sp. NPDC051463]|uniref:hypothetical protein n=1 Tax=Nocardia sp. NPDC051463 TaxID=3154845 RepID=UPI00344BEA66